MPSPAALAIEAAPWRDLEPMFQRGVTPDLESLIGWQWRGINRAPSNLALRLAGIKKFVKGMFRAGDGRVMGYNCPVVQNALDGRWRTTPSDEAPKRFGFYTVAPVDPTARDNHYLHALLLDYGQGDNPLWDPSRHLRDYLVQVRADNPDLLLGKAYVALGPARIATSYFILERFRRAAG
ncbi:MAG TPA: hypothetical protein VFP84_34055 [Kofleriaceae bacterium]|nr:hypothetical protein [Kofleriaceae bacterium]